MVGSLDSTTGGCMAIYPNLFSWYVLMYGTQALNDYEIDLYRLLSTNMSINLDKLIF